VGTHTLQTPVERKKGIDNSEDGNGDLKEGWLRGKNKPKGRVYIVEKYRKTRKKTHRGGEPTVCAKGTLGWGGLGTL